MEANEVARGQTFVAEIVHQEIARLGLSLESLEWGQDAGDFSAGQHSLAVVVNGRRSVEGFSTEDLSDAPATPNRTRLAQQVRSWLQRLVPGQQIGFRGPQSP